MTPNRNLDILTKAFPHMPARAQMCIDVILKISQLRESIDNINNNASYNLGAMNSDNISACNYNPDRPVNLEALFKDIRPVCSRQDAKFIDMYLNFIKSKNILNTYRAMNGGESNDDFFVNELFKNTSYATQKGEYSDAADNHSF